MKKKQAGELVKIGGNEFWRLAASSKLKEEIKKAESWCRTPREYFCGIATPELLQEEAKVSTVYSCLRDEKYIQLFFLVLKDRSVLGAETSEDTVVLKKFALSIGEQWKEKFSDAHFIVRFVDINVSTRDEKGDRDERHLTIYKL